MQRMTWRKLCAQTKSKAKNEALLNNVDYKGQDGSMVIFQDQFVHELEKLIMNMVIQRFEVNTLSFTIVLFFW